MADYDEKTNPFPAIRELQDITRDLDINLRELKERVQIIEDSIKNVRVRMEVIEEVVYRLEGK